MAEEKVWKPLELIKVTADFLAGKGVPDSRVDAEVLLVDVMGLRLRVDLYAGFERDISGKELAAYREVVRRRALREPVSRILGRRGFMGIDFRVTPDVLSPRPETELLVETALEAVLPKKNRFAEEAEAVAATVHGVSGGPGPGSMPEELERILDSYAEDVDGADDPDDVPLSAPGPFPGMMSARALAKKTASAKKKTGPITAGRTVRALDLGTGSGCIAVAVAVHLPGAVVVAVDASPKALSVARKNASGAGVADRVDFRQGDWFAGCKDDERFDLILSNPPYLIEGDPGIWPEVRGYDPPLALYGGQDGLDCYRRIVPEAASWLVPDGLLLLEVGAGQAPRVANLMRSRGFSRVECVRDYGGVERVVMGSMAEL